MISIFSLIISFFAFVLVCLNRNDKFRPQLFAYYVPNAGDGWREGIIFIKNESDVPAFISSVNVQSVYDIYTKTEDPDFERPGEDLSDAKIRKRYIHIEDSFKKLSENMTYLPREKEAVQLIDIISTESRNDFDNTNMYRLLEQQKEKNFKVFEQEISLIVEYKKAKLTLPFAIRGVDKFKEKLIVFQGSMD